MKTLRVLAFATVGSIALALAALILAAQAPAGSVGAEHQQPWGPALRRMDDALAQRNVTAALLAFRSAHLAALGSRRWEGMADVGDAALRLNAALTPPRTMKARAREAYLNALFRARADQSLDGVLRVTEAFARLGDRDVVAQCLAIAETLASGRHDAAGVARVRALAERLNDRTLTAQDTLYEEAR